MEKYIGTKVIKAQPMTRGDYNKLRGWDLPESDALAEDWEVVE